MTIKRVGIMGGTFDPIHLGHLVAANEALNICSLDNVIFVPTGNPPHKEETCTSFYHRYIMTCLATLSNDKFLVSDIESKSSGKSYTLNTLQKFHRMYPDTEFYFITGTDEVIDLPEWYKSKELLKLCKVLAVSRPGVNKEDLEKKIEEIKKNLNGHIELVQIPMLYISSTGIREKFENGVSVKYLLPESVEQYIIKNNLYR